MVGVTGFEPATSWSQTRRSTKLSYTPRLKRASCNMARSTVHPESCESILASCVTLRHTSEIAACRFATISRHD